MRFTNIQGWLTAALLLSLCPFASAKMTVTTVADSVAPLVIAGHVDVYYRYGSNKIGSLTAYTPAANGFGLGMANLQVSKDKGKVGFMADLMFGTRAEQTNYNYSTNPTGFGLSSSQAFIKQLYVTYKPTDALKFTFGNFTTFFGYELVEAANNLNYSMSYTFTNGPFFHTGIKAEYALNSHWTAMIGIFNRTDWKLDTTTRKFIGGQLAYVNGSFKLYLNALSGSDIEKFTTSTFDLTAAYQATKKLGLGLNITSKNIAPEAGSNKRFLGESVYVNYATSNTFTLAARYEYFDDSKSAAGIGATISQFTISGNLKVDALTIVPEIRFDSADKSIYNGEKSDFSFLLAGIYKF